MNIHCIYTLTILLLQTLPATANLWDNLYVHHSHYDQYAYPIIEVERPKIVNFRAFDDDYNPPLRRYHVFETYERPPPPPPTHPVIYVPKIHFSPDLYEEEEYPTFYDHFGEPVIAPLIKRSHTTVTFSYKAKVIPVHDITDENLETIKTSVKSQKPVTDAKKETNTQENVQVTTVPVVKEEPVWKPKAEAEARPVSVEKSTANVKPVTKPEILPKPEVPPKPESVLKPEPQAAPKLEEASKPVAVPTSAAKPETENKPENDKKSESEKPKESNSDSEAAKASDNNKDVEKKPVDVVVKKSEAEGSNAPAAETKVESNPTNGKSDDAPVNTSA